MIARGASRGEGARAGRGDRCAAALAAPQRARHSPLRQRRVAGRVELDPKLAASVAPDDTVFIFARAADGPRMPLAAMKVRGADLPTSFALDDSMAMAPAATHLQGAEGRRRGARQQIGQRDAAAGRPARHQRAGRAGRDGVRVIIDRVVP